MADRHARQSALPDVGTAGTARLREAKVLVVGLGGLGCPAALYLAGAGVGTLGLCDPDAVDVTNLHRQTLYSMGDVGRPKAEAAAQRLRLLDPDLRLVPMQGRVGFGNAEGLVAGWDLVVDGTDDLDARYALSDACAAAGIPLVHGAVSAWEGECTVFAPPGGPCYRCLYPAPPVLPLATCATEGVLGTVPGVVGTMQAQETLKILTGAGEPLVGRMTLVDGRAGTTRTISLKRRDGCICTVQNPWGRAGTEPSGAACPLPWNAPSVPTISATEYEARKDELFLLDVREPEEFDDVHMPNAHLIPLGQLPAQIATLPRDRTIVCQCAVGGRSARAADLLRRHGYSAVNLAGGIQAWLAIVA